MPNGNASPPSLGDPYSKARTLTVMASGLLLVSALGDIELRQTLPLLKISLPEAAQARIVLAALTGYGTLRSVIEWFQAHPQRRRRSASRIDVGLTIAVAIVALTVYVFDTLELSFITWRFVVTAGALGTGGYLVGQAVGAAIWSIPFVRSSKRARRLALPRVPVAVRSSLAVAAASCLLAALALPAWFMLARASFVTWFGVFLLPLLIVVAARLVEVFHWQYTLDDGTSVPADEYRGRIGKALDLHDTLYRQQGSMAAIASPPSDLFCAAEKGDVDDVRERLRMGADPDQREHFGWTPLMIATAQQHDKAVTELLDAGADPNICNTLGRTPLMLASRYGNARLVRVLLNAGADPNLQRFRHEPPALVAAAAGGHEEVVRQLLNAGSDPHACDGEGKTALDMAHAGGHGEVAAVLRKRLRRESAHSDEEPTRGGNSHSSV